MTSGLRYPLDPLSLDYDLGEPYHFIVWLRLESFILEESYSIEYMTFPTVVESARWDIDWVRTDPQVLRYLSSEQILELVENDDVFLFHHEREILSTLNDENL